MKTKTLLAACAALSCAGLFAGGNIHFQMLPERWKPVWALEFNDGKFPEDKLVRGSKPYSSAPKNLRIENGCLVLESHLENAGTTNKHYSSGAVTMAGKTPVKYGRIDVSVKFPAKARGAWPCVWLCGNYDGRKGYEYNWPGSFEVDLAEYLGSRPGVIDCAVHYRKQDGKHCGKEQFPWGCPIPGENFVEYSVVWTPEMMRFFWNTNCFWGVDTEEATCWGRNTFRERGYLMITEGVSDNWMHKGIDEAALPWKTEVDYIRYWEWVEPPLDTTRWLPLVPQPQKWEPVKGAAAEIDPAKLKIVKRTDPKAKLPKEGYEITIDREAMTLVAATAEGLRFAETSAKQLRRSGMKLPPGKVTDHPWYGYRGFELDCGAKKFSLPFLRKLVKTMAWYKMNELTLRLVGDDGRVRLASESCPDLVTKDGGVYTKAEMRALAKEAEALGVRVNPMFRCSPRDKFAALAKEFVGRGGVFTSRRVHLDGRYGNYGAYSADIVAAVKELRKYGCEAEVWGKFGTHGGRGGVNPAHDLTVDYDRYGGYSMGQLLKDGFHSVSCCDWTLIFGDDKNLSGSPEDAYDTWDPRRNVYEFFEKDDGKGLIAGGKSMYKFRSAAGAKKVTEDDAWSKIEPMLMAVGARTWRKKRENKDDRVYWSKLKTIRDAIGGPDPR